ncbi:hypothetical protein F4778DRAFT_610250 [Xylariomycetidae sp. FL2044]|nr:hypothetical protein F4778DRAFT_610250 [Xylariomycetidae sp. FL2044]
MAPEHTHLAARAGIQAGSRQASVYGVGIAFIIIIAVVISARMYVRQRIIRALGMDDILMLIGTIFTFGLSIASIMAAHYGVGKHIADIPLEDYTPMLQSIYSTRLLYVVAVFCVKESLLMFYLRLDNRRTMRWTVYALMFAVAGFSIASFIILAVTCFPPALFWDMTGTVVGKCIAPASQQAFYDANGALNIVLDLAIYITPIPVLWKVQIPKRQKIALIGVFCLGFLSVAAGGVRFGYVRLLVDEEDMYFLLADSLNWCEIEIYIAILCGSAPALKVLLKVWWPRIFGSSNQYSPRYPNGHYKSSSNYATIGGSGDKSGSRKSRHMGTTDSKEAIVTQDNRIVKKTEFTMEVSD